MKKSRIWVCLGLIGLLTIHVCISSSFIARELVFITSYWNTLDYDSGEGLDDWNEAGKVGFSFLGYSGNIYVKNDYQNVYLGILVHGKTNFSTTWRINFDIDADSYWAEDAKELRVSGGGLLTIDDQTYLQGDPIPYSDSQSSDFTAKLRNLELFGEDYSIFEVTIPFKSDDLLNDLQVTNPEESIIGVSLDVFDEISGSNATWKGASYPFYANSANFAQIIFAGPQDRQIPIFEEAPPVITTTTAEETEERSYEEGAASGFEIWMSIFTMGLLVYILVNRRKTR
jgi:hypothetical protein